MNKKFGLELLLEVGSLEDDLLSKKMSTPTKVNTVICDNKSKIVAWQFVPSGGMALCAFRKHVNFFSRHFGGYNSMTTRVAEKGRETCMPIWRGLP